MTDKTKFNGWTPKVVIVKSTEIAKEETPLNKETKAKMMEYIKNNSTKSLKELIKKFYKK
jgi:hypothetical protein